MILLDHCFIACVQMSPFLLAFEAISVTSANGLVARFCELQCNLDVSVDFENKWGMHCHLSIMGTLITNIYQIWRDAPFQITTFLKIYTHTRYIPLTIRVFGPYCKLQTEFFSIDLWPKREARGP